MVKDGFLIKPDGGREVLLGFTAGNFNEYFARASAAVGGANARVILSRKTSRFFAYTAHDPNLPMNPVATEVLEFLGFIIPDWITGNVVIVKAGDRGLDAATISVLEDICQAFEAGVPDATQLEREMGREKMALVFTDKQLESHFAKEEDDL